MKYNIIGRNVDLTEALNTAIHNSCEKLEKYFNENTEATITLSVEKQRHIMEITIPFNSQVLRAETEGDNMYKIIDTGIDTIEKQILRFKNKLRTKNRNNTDNNFTSVFLSGDEVEADDSLKIERRKKFAIKPMNSEEAVLQMELIGHNFYVYLDAETEEVNVVYKRRNNSYGLIEPQLH